MSEYFGFCNTWPAALKEAWRKQNKLRCRLRCLEGCLDRTDYSDFETLFNELEKVQQELFQACFEFEQLQRRYCGTTSA